MYVHFNTYACVYHIYSSNIHVDTFVYVKVLFASSAVAFVGLTVNIFSGLILGGGFNCGSTPGGDTGDGHGHSHGHTGDSMYKYMYRQFFIYAFIFK
jgi:hypothetical protein